MSELNTEQVRELLEKATPGRWMAGQPEPGRPVEVMVRFSEEGTDEDDYNDNDLMLCDTYTGHSGRLAGLLDIDAKKDPRISAADNANLIAAAPDLARLVLAQAEELVRLKAELANSVETNQP